MTGVYTVLWFNYQENKVRCGGTFISPDDAENKRHAVEQELRAVAATGGPGTLEQETLRIAITNLIAT